MTNALKTAAFLLPRPGIDLAKWSVIACDQFTAQPEYWRAVEAVVGDAPSSITDSISTVAVAPAGTESAHASSGAALSTSSLTVTFLMAVDW